MNIAHFTNAYLPVISGVVRSIYSFRRALLEQGHNVFIFAQDGSDYQDQEPFIFRYPTIDLPLSTDVPVAIPFSACWDQLLPALKPQVIHAHHPVLLGQVAAKKASELGVPLVFTFHTQYREYSHYFPISQEIVQGFIRNAIDNWIRDYMRKCYHIVVPTQSMCEVLVRDYGLRNNFTVIPTGVDLSVFKQADGKQMRQQHGWEDDVVLIGVGRLSHEKNWATLLQAAALAMQAQPRLRLVLVGDGPERGSLEQLAAELGVSERLSFLGQVPYESVPAYLKAADLYGFASTAETQGLATVEAMAAGLPVVAVCATGTKDVVQDGREGFLTDNDPQAICQAILDILANPKQIEKFRAACLKTAAAYDQLALASRLVSVYEEAIEAKKANQLVELEEVDA